MSKIAYLPTMFTAFTEREAAVTMLEVRAGDPPSAVEMIARTHRIRGLDNLSEVWPVWEAWSDHSGFDDNIYKAYNLYKPYKSYRLPKGDGYGANDRHH